MALNKGRWVSKRAQEEEDAKRAHQAADRDAKQIKAISETVAPLIRAVGDIEKHIKAEHDRTERKEESKWPRRRKEIRQWLVVVAVILASFFAARQWYVMLGQLTEMRQARKETEAELRISQGARVTIGRSDGVVGDLIVPKDPGQNAEIVVYFRNSGHLPAKFAWGTMAAFRGTDMNGSSGIKYVHPFKGGLSRTRNIKDGSIGEQGEDTLIAGDSVFVSTIGEISQKDLADMPSNHAELLILGMYEYCDELGEDSKRMFSLRYRSNAPVSSRSFDLSSDTEMPNLPLPHPTATIEYLPPCETSEEREHQSHQ
jgi:hypothetical protein